MFRIIYLTARIDCIFQYLQFPFLGTILLLFPVRCCQVRGERQHSSTRFLLFKANGAGCFYIARCGFSAAFLTITLQFVNLSGQCSSSTGQSWQYFYFYHWLDPPWACPEICPEWGLPRLPSPWGGRIIDCFSRAQMLEGKREMRNKSTKYHSSHRTQRDGNSADTKEFIPFNRWNIKKLKY